jgi:hypothetical protein
MRVQALLLATIPLALAAEFESGGVQVKILGQSGKMTLTSSEIDLDVTIEMGSLYELDADGNEVGGGGPPSGKHSLETFAPQDFTIDSNPTREEFGGVAVDKIDFQTTLVNGAADFKVCDSAQACIHSIARG